MRLAVLAGLFTAHVFGQVVITDSGSTNRRGMTISLGGRGSAVIDDQHGAKIRMKLTSDLHARLMRDVEAAAPLDQLEAQHCMKSASFGSSTFITYKGVRSPDLSCPGQTDPLAIALQQDLEEIMVEAHAKAPMSSRRPLLPTL